MHKKFLRTFFIVVLSINGSHAMQDDDNHACAQARSRPAVQTFDESDAAMFSATAVFEVHKAQFEMRQGSSPSARLMTLNCRTEVTSGVLGPRREQHIVAVGGQDAKYEKDACPACSIKKLLESKAALTAQRSVEIYAKALTEYEKATSTYVTHLRQKQDEWEIRTGKKRLFALTVFGQDFFEYLGSWLPERLDSRTLYIGAAGVGIATVSWLAGSWSQQCTQATTIVQPGPGKSGESTKMSAKSATNPKDLK